MKNRQALLQRSLLALALGLAASAPAGTITDSMVVHLPFDNTYDNRAASTVAASPVGSPAFTGGKVGNGALSFSSDKNSAFFNYVTLGTPPELNFGGSVDLTVSAWVKFTTWTGDPSFIANKNWSSGGNLGWVLATADNGGFQWNFTDGSPRKDFDGTGGTLSGGNWHHIAVSFDRDGNAVTFLDGVQVDSQPIGPGLDTLDSGLPTNIGQDGTGAYTDNASVGIADGTIDDVGIWRRALSAFELRRIYEFGTNGVAVSDIPDAAGPEIVSVSPVNGATSVRVDTAISAVITDGALPLNPATVSLKLNGTAAAATLEKVGLLTTVTHQPAAPLPFRSTNRVELVFGSSPTALSTSKWTFVTTEPAQSRGIAGQWDFEKGDLSATIGQPLQYRFGPSGETAAHTAFGTTRDFGLPDIDGLPARVMKIAVATTNSIGYIMNHGALPNGDPAATKVNQWTLIMDIFIPNAGGETWLSFIQIDDPIANGNDGDLFARFAGGAAGLGISSVYEGSLTAGQWHRVAFALDMAHPTTPVISKFIDGVKVGDQSRSAPQLNGRHSLFPTAILFADESGESQPAYVSSIQIRNYKVSDIGMAALGGPTADGIPLVSGQWDFENGDLTATIGSELIPRPGTDVFTIFDIDAIDGTIANVMRFGYGGATPDNELLGYLLPHGTLPNGGGQKANQYSLILDLNYSSTSTGFRSIFQVATNNDDDGDLFVNGGNGIGINSQYHGNLSPDAWHRVVFTVDLTKRELGKYIDGSNVLSGPVGSAPLGTGPFQYLSLSANPATGGGVDQRWALDPLALLFADEDGEIAPGSVNSIQFRAEVLTPSQVARLGRASATGIPIVIPPQPVLQIVMGSFGLPELSWPARFADYILESSPSLGADANWTTVPDVDGTLYEESRQPNPAFFYRLRKQ